MTIIKVDPASVRGYGAAAQGIFDSMQSSLVSLVNEVVAVRYFGPNAVAFKTECGRLASEFANALNKDMQAFAESVRISTSNIAASLGGAPISIQVDNRQIVPPAPQVVDYVDIDTAALESLVPVVIGRFNALRQGLATNQTNLGKTIWEGAAKNSAEIAVGRLTTSGNGKCDEAEQSITRYMNDQLQSVLAADR
jgi:hypothetical protein